MATDGKAEAQSPEGAVRLYLMYLQDPAKLRDESAITNLRTSVAEAADPIDKLKALASLERAEAVDPEPFLREFVDHAKKWATENDVSANAFIQMGVPTDVLTDAGFAVARGQARSLAHGSSGEAKRKRAPSVPTETIREYVLSRKEPFTVQDVREGVGGSTATVSKVVKQLVSEGAVTDRGPIANHSGRGRAPTGYAVS
ncbi:MAG: hypothetical protein U0U69_05710 [Acidimicrobiia bacterium]